jgi:hypothetical protein
MTDEMPPRELLSRVLAEVKVEATLMANQLQDRSTRERLSFGDGMLAAHSLNIVLHCETLASAVRAFDIMADGL